MAGVKVDIEIQGLKEVRAKLRADELLRGPWSAAMHQIEQQLGAAWRGAIPVDTGRARDSIKTRVSAAAIPRYVLVKTTATKSSARYKRYRYPGRQEWDPRSKNKGRLMKAFESVRARAQGVLDQAARQIEAKWRS